MSSLETYYTRSHEAYSKLVPYTFPVAMMLIITNKLALYCWNFMDLFLIIMCTALYMRIEKLGIYIEKKSRFHNHPIGMISYWKTKNKFFLIDVLCIVEYISRESDEKYIWERLYEKFVDTIELLELFEKFLSPLLFMTHSENVYAFCMQVENLNFVFFFVWRFCNFYLFSDENVANSFGKHKHNACSVFNVVSCAFVRKNALGIHFCRQSK